VSGSLSGRNAIITGGSQGLGLAIARAYVAEGANVMICARESTALRTAEEELRMLASSDQRIAGEICDVSREDEVRQLVAQSIALFDQVHILVNNAAIHGPIGTIESVDWEQWKRAIDVNLHGSVLPCRFLVPHMREHRYGKVVQLSGGGATDPRPRFSAYAASKAAVVRFAETLAEETRGSGIDVNAIAPGALNTRLLDDVIAAGPEQAGHKNFSSALKQKEAGGAPLTRGADLAVFLASAASDGITGKLLSAIWDPWETLPEHAQALSGDIYTLRRIVPKDRGFDWGDR
jgi:NAD(P)-dependent dehydrogenase (short-subunit alcohol dehydrogenase family)